MESTEEVKVPSTNGSIRIPLKWVVWIIVAVLVPTLSWFAIRDHDSFVERDRELKQAIEDQKRIDIQQSEELSVLKEQHKTVAASLAEIKADMKSQNEMMTKILVELRKAR